MKLPFAIAAESNQELGKMAHAAPGLWCDKSRHIPEQELGQKLLLMSPDPGLIIPPLSRDGMEAAWPLQEFSTWARARASQRIRPWQPWICWVSGMLWRSWVRPWTFSE